VGKAVPAGCGSLLDGKIPGKIVRQPVWMFSPDRQAIDISTAGEANSLTERTGI
jgi:hypothetical protein